MARRVCATGGRSGGAAAREPARQLERLVERVERDLDAVAVALRARPGRRCRARRRTRRTSCSTAACLVGVQLAAASRADRCGSASPAARARRSSSRTDQPAAAASRARRRRASWSVASSSARPWPSLSSPRSSSVERLVGQVEQADQVRDGDAAAADAAADVLAREAELLDQRGAGARLLDRVEVLARHVLDQRQLERGSRRRVGARSPGSARGRRAARRASGARRRSARSGRRRSGRTSTGCSTPRSSIELGERGQRLLVEAPARLVRVRADQLDAGSARSSSGSSVGRRQDRREAAAHAAMRARSRGPMPRASQPRAATSLASSK